MAETPAGLAVEHGAGGRAAAVSVASALKLRSHPDLDLGRRIENAIAPMLTVVAVSVTTSRMLVDELFPGARTP